MKKTLLYLLLILSSQNVLAQYQYPIFTQNYSNPYLINPSLASNAAIPEINATYRQQWVQIKNGPQTIQADVQYPINNRMAIAAYVYNDKTVLLTNTGFVGTFAYRVPLSSQHSIGFGLSAGMLSNRIDLNNIPAVDLIDPVLTKSSNNANFTSQFGMHYKYRRFTLGISLLNLFDNTPFLSEPLKIDGKNFSPFRDKTVHASYSTKLSRQIGLITNLLYRSTDFNGDYFQGTALVNINGKIDVGAGYRTDFGPHVAVRFKIKSLHAGYAYDFVSKNYGSAPGGSNELQLKWQFGEDYTSIENDTMSMNNAHKKKTISKTQEDREVQTEDASEEVVPSQDETKVVAKIEEQPPVKTEEIKPIKTEETKPVVVTEALPKQQDPVVVQNDIKPEKDVSVQTTKWLLIVGAFAVKEHAEDFVKQLKNQGVIAEMKTLPGETLYFVHVPKYSSDQVDLEQINKIRQNTVFKDAWFKRLD